MGSAAGGYANSYWRTYITWSSSNVNDYQADITVNLYMDFKKSWSKGVDMTHNSTSCVQVDGQSATGIYSTFNHAIPYGGSYTIHLGSATYRVNRNHGRNVYVYGALGRSSGFNELEGSSAAGGYEWVSAKTSYAVSYNANGGSGTIANQTKWYAENLTLSDGTGFTWAHHTLMGWNTAADGTGTHYDLGSSYTANAGTTLYAEWKLNAVLTSGKVNGAWKSGTLRAKVNGTWVIPYKGYGKVNGSWKEIKE